MTSWEGPGGFFGVGLNPLALELLRELQARREILEAELMPTACDLGSPHRTKVFDFDGCVRLCVARRDDGDEAHRPVGGQVRAQIQCATLPLKGTSEDGHSIIGTLSRRLAAGAWTVNWQIASSDGHRMTGSYAFTVR